MAISTVRAQINGTWYTLTLSAGKWTASITAPGATSFNQPGGYYDVTVEAANTAGTKATATGATLPGLRLVVKETVKPVVTILSPTTGAYVSNSRQPIVFNAVDEAGGSGINLSSLVVRVDGVVAASGITSTSITNGYSITYTPPTAMADGAHTVEVSIVDNDGNVSVAKSTSYTIDTVPPVLNISSPADGLVTATAALTVAGVTNDASSSPVTVGITLNGVSQGSATVDGSGGWAKGITLQEGANTIVITATDAAGQTTTVNRSITLDSSVPIISSVTITPNPVDAGQTMLIEAVVQ